MENTTEIVQRLSDPTITYSEKKFLVGRIRELALQNKGIIFIASLTKLFHILENLIQLDKQNSSNPELSIQIVELLNILVSNTDPETEIFLTKFMSNILPSLNSENAILKKNIINYIQRYLAKTLNFEAVFSVVNKNCLDSSEWRIRVTILEAIENWWKNAIAHAKALQNLPEARKLVQNIVQKLKDESDVVKKSAQNTLFSMTLSTPEAIYFIIQKLPTPLISIYNDLMLAEHIEQYQPPVTVIKNEQIDQNDEELKQAISSSTSKTMENIDWPELDGLVFGIIPDCIVKDLGPTSNWKERAAAIDDLKDIIKVPANIEKLEMYFSSFFKFIVRLLNDTNYKVSVGTLQIISIF